jgi:tRNA modification GTPase
MAHNQTNGRKGKISFKDDSTIVAVATPQGRGGIGVIRISGPAAYSILCHISKRNSLAIKKAQFCQFYDQHDQVLDTGIALFFASPASFTGEDVAELQVHSNPYLMDMLVEQVISLGARPAQAGEFSLRAFLNQKLDLAQAEAIADLIDSGSRQAALLAGRTLSGFFSQYIIELKQEITQLRVFIEASFDFADEDIETITLDNIQDKIKVLVGKYTNLIRSANKGRVMQEGLQIVLAGEPNVGKSSLLNMLAGQDCAIVTDLPGTTRDLLKEQINLDGIPLHIIDTAGLRATTDPIEVLGIDKAKRAMMNCDHLLWIVDDSNYQSPNIPTDLPKDLPVTLIRNKIDLSGKYESIEQRGSVVEIGLSARTGQGIDLLKQHIKNAAGITEFTEGDFTVRRRHIAALQRSQRHMQEALRLILLNFGSEFIAEELRLAQQSLGEITGEYTSDDLLGEIFSSFCIGK